MTKLKEGDKAPNFKSKDQNGNPVALADFKGKKLVLYFYPKDDTPGCTKEACNFRDNYSMLKKKGFEVVGVSTDNEKSHQKFIDKYDLPFTLISDDDKKIVEAFGVWGEKKFMGKTYLGTNRVTFLIEDGKILKIITKVDTNDSAKQILEMMSEK